jgi:hypothetical protein
MASPPLLAPSHEDGEVKEEEEREAGERNALPPPVITAVEIPVARQAGGANYFVVVCTVR